MRVVIAEDASLLRELLAQVLSERGHQVCAAVADAEAVRAAVEEHRPDVTVLDIRMPPTHTDEGLRAAIDLRREQPGTAVLLFSQYVETTYATRLLAAGSAGVGYLLKDRVAEHRRVHRCPAAVAAGEPRSIRRSSPAGGRQSPHRDLELLTDRERDVLSLMAQGRSNAAIAQTLMVSLGTVEKHVAVIFAKLRLQLAGRQPSGACRAALPADVTFAGRAVNGGPRR